MFSWLWTFHYPQGVRPMSQEPDDVVRVAAGEMVAMEMYQQALIEEGIEARVVGESLGASFGTAISGSVEVWVSRSHELQAQAILRKLEHRKGEPASESHSFPHPTSDPHPTRAGGHGPHTHYRAKPEK